ncbi:MAG TPA: pyridoxamine 5'-phosphate oxidase family protein [Gemmatimonadaceae bacterium]|nr:pyridoxamine 5'-phosphate oxidase family protein [Gemmatimonadaceae bacterium]
MTRSNAAADATNRFGVSNLNRVRRHPERAHYDRATVYDILDRGLVAHVAFVDHGRPIVIPMTYGRDRDRMYLHGARRGRVSTATNGEPVSIGVTLVDGLVIARSLFDSSMNYRAVVIHGHAVDLEDRAERLHALRCISEHVLPGRWDEVREPSEQELKGTVVLAVEIEAASAKVRAHGVVQGKVPGDERMWAGVIPISSTVGSPVPDPETPADVPVPPSVARFSGGG